MDVRLTSEQQQLRDAAAKLADDLGPGSVADLDDEIRRARLEKAVDATGWRSLRSDGASGVEVAIVAEEFARGLVDVPFLGPVLADDLNRSRSVATSQSGATCRGLESRRPDRKPSRRSGRIAAAELAELSRRGRRPLARAGTGRRPTADLVGAARGTLTLATDYAKVREQYGATIGSYQAVAHLLAESLALIEGSVSVLRHAAWAVDELPAAEAVRSRPGGQDLLRACGADRL